MQTVSTEYTNAMDDPTKRADFILAISGWPTLYSVASSAYSLAGDLANFTGIKAWMSIPRGASSKVKGRPEGGSVTIGETVCKIQDRVSGGSRALSDLASRFAYLLGESTGNENQLDGTLAIGATTVTVDSTTGFPSAGTIHIGQECISYTGTTATTFTGCTRGYLLTDAQAHVDNVKVYGYTPNLHRRKAYLYKGTQDITLDKWERAFGGVITDEHKDGAELVLTIDDSVWETHLDRRAFVMNPWLRNGAGAPATIPPQVGELDADLGGNVFENIDFTLPSTGNLTSGHWVGVVGGEYVAIRDES